MFCFFWALACYDVFIENLRVENETAIQNFNDLESSESEYKNK
jgi:hypothetical protein